MPYGDGNQILHLPDLDLYLHPTYGCWFNCKFVLIFDNLVFEKVAQPTERPQKQYIREPELTKIKNLLKLNTPASRLEALMQIQHGKELKYPVGLLKYLYPNCPAHLYNGDLTPFKQNQRIFAVGRKSDDYNIAPFERQSMMSHDPEIPFE